MVWLVFALPLLVIVAAAITFQVARGPVDAVFAPVRRTAQVQTADFSAERTALALGARARLVIDRSTGAASLSLRRADEPSALVLTLVHPVDASHDRQVPVTRDGKSWLTVVPSASHDWLLQLSPSDGHWRLVGRVTPRQTRVELRPGLQE
jgi:hypothetical protein